MGGWRGFLIFVVVVCMHENYFGRAEGVSGGFGLQSSSLQGIFFLTIVRYPCPAKTGLRHRSLFRPRCLDADGVESVFRDDQSRNGRQVTSSTSTTPVMLVYRNRPLAFSAVLLASSKYSSRKTLSIGDLIASRLPQSTF